MLYLVDSPRLHLVGEVGEEEEAAARAHSPELRQPLMRAPPPVRAPPPLASQMRAQGRRAEVEEGDGDERVDGVGDELLLGECELVVLELIFLQEVGDHGCEMRPGSIQEEETMARAEGGQEVGDRGEGEEEGQGGNKTYEYFVRAAIVVCL